MNLMSDIDEKNWVALRFSLARNSPKRHLSPLECAVLLKKIHKKYTKDYVSEKLGVSKGMISKILQLDNIKSGAVRQSVSWGQSKYRDGLISMSSAKYIARLDNEDMQKKLYDLACNNNLTKTEIKSIIPAFNRGESLEAAVKTMIGFFKLGYDIVTKH